LPLVTLFNGLTNFLVAAAIGAPLFAIWVITDYRPRAAPSAASSKAGRRRR